MSAADFDNFGRWLSGVLPESSTPSASLNVARTIPTGQREDLPVGLIGGATLNPARRSCPLMSSLNGFTDAVGREIECSRELATGLRASVRLAEEM